MAKRITGIGGSLVKHMPWMAVVLAVYQYYAEAGGFQGFFYDIKNVNMAVLKAKWQNVGIAVACFVGADTIARYVPGKLRYVVKAVLYYFGASMMLDILQDMYRAPAAVANGASGAAIGAGVRGY